MIKLTLPFPPRYLNPNSHIDKWAKAAAAKQYRYDCKIEALQARDRKRIALKAPVRAVVTICCGKRMLDADNAIAAFKAGMDGIVESGLIPDDSPDVLQVDYRVIGGEKRNVIVELEEA